MTTLHTHLCPSIHPSVYSVFIFFPFFRWQDCNPTGFICLLLYSFTLLSLFHTPCHLISQKIRLLVCSFCQNVHRVQQKERQRESGRQIGRIMTHTHMRARTHARTPHTHRMVPLNLYVFSKLASAFSIFFRDDKLSYLFSADFE